VGLDSQRMGETDGYNRNLAYWQDEEGGHYWSDDGSSRKGDSLDGEEVEEEVRGLVNRVVVSSGICDLLDI
jgi:hypothetical protein